EAVAAGRPVVSTAFPHAIELLADETGIVVPQRDPAALTAALRRVLSEPELAERMAERAAVKAPDLLWSAVARRYRDIATALAASSLAAAS
ncbi:MAG: polysaccharide biosynthesis protein PslF, partial [Pseudonocardiales bacterium]|nr:polysaccharide biosynthesis protein PslF [Pseudonocardiales bacterium]